MPPELSEVSSSELLRDYECVEGKLLRKDRERSYGKAAFVGVYGIHCGISTYSQALWDQMYRLFSDHRIFCEYGTLSLNPRALGCWQRGKPLSLLLDEINHYNPDVVFIQHEYGIFPSAAHWLALLSGLRGRRVIVTLHSVYDHLDKLVCEAAIPEIVVHTELAEQALRRKGITAPIHIIPHGCGMPSYEPLWNIYRSQHTLLQFGFGFRYKGWETSLRCVAELRNFFPDVFFTALISSSPFDGPDADLYFEELHKLVEELKIQDHVALIRGFQSELVLDSYLRTNTVGIFPYQDNHLHRVYGCSGAARRAMATGLPIVTTPVPLFHDLKGIVPQESEVEGLVREVKLLFDPRIRGEQRAKQNDFLNNHSWSRMADRYRELL